MTAPSPQPWLGAGDVERLRTALDGADFTADGIGGYLGASVSAAHGRGDLAAVERATRDTAPLATLIRLFLLGEDVPAAAAAAALAPLPVETALGVLLEPAADGGVRATMDLRPYAETEPGPDPGSAASGSQWWVVSDLGADVRNGPMAGDHVLGIGSAALTLAQLTVRSPVGSALDLGVGCGVQSLHLSRHAARVVGTDLSPRALRMAATTAALNGLEWDLRLGSLLEPVGEDTFDQIVSNPPFVVGPPPGAAAATFDYRDSRLAGDEVSRRLVSGMPARLNPGGLAQLLANWAITADQEWDERVAGWLAGGGCDAWVWQREVADPAEYVALWLRDAGSVPGSPGYRAAYDRWLSWFEEVGVLGIGMGLVSMHRTDRADVTVVCEDVRQAVQQPAAAEIGGWFSRVEWLAARGSGRLLASRVRPRADLVLTEHSMLTPDGWVPRMSTLRSAGGMRWEIDTDRSVAAIVGGCAAGATLGEIVQLLARASASDPDETAAAAVPVLRDLIQRGLLVPRPPDGADPSRTDPEV